MCQTCPKHVSQGCLSFRHGTFRQWTFRHGHFGSLDISACVHFGTRDVSARGPFGTRDVSAHGRFGTRDVSARRRFGTGDISAHGRFFSAPKIFRHQTFFEKKFQQKNFSVAKIFTTKKIFPHQNFFYNKNIWQEKTSIRNQKKSCYNWRSNKSFGLKN